MAKPKDPIQRSVLPIPDVTPIVTCDTPPAKAPGHRARIDVSE